uniref:Presenilin n=1 Tax=Ephydatia fluviatilis TaxID=31330 RepID=Q4AEI4_9METZ|nr:presenilin [Ephydatia fluviatilis]
MEQENGEKYDSEEATVQDDRTPLSASPVTTPSHEGEGTEGGASSSGGCKACLQSALNVLPSIGEDSEDDREHDEEILKFGATQVIMLMVPVLICMVLVVATEITVSLLQPPSGTYLVYTPLREESAGSGGVTFLFALVNALIVIGLVVVMTVVLVLLFKFECYRAIQGWLLLSSASLLFVFCSLFFVNILYVHNLLMDWFTFALIVWNFGVVGLLVIHWKGPLRLQQAYLIMVCAVAASVLLKYLPNWTTWVLLALISVYDLIAVMCPKGPLRILVNLAKERNMDIFPSLIYSSTMVWTIGMADSNEKKDDEEDKDSDGEKESTSIERSQQQATLTGEGSQYTAHRDGASVEGGASVAAVTIRNAGNGEGAHVQHSEEEEEGEERRGFKLGLGDFIFYSILVGRAAHDSDGDWVIISSCFVAILIGLCLTSLILGIVRRALPALPISIFFGLMFYFSSRYLIAPFVNVMITTQVFM